MNSPFTAACINRKLTQGNPRPDRRASPIFQRFFAGSNAICLGTRWRQNGNKQFTVQLRQFRLNLFFIRPDNG